MQTLKAYYNTYQRVLSICQVDLFYRNCNTNIVYYLKTKMNRKQWQFLAHLTQRVMWAIVTTERPSSVVRRPSVNFSHFNQLLWNHWANLNQTLVEWSLDGPLPKLCPVIPTSNQDGRQAKNRKKGGWNFNCSLLL